MSTSTEPRRFAPLSAGSGADLHDRRQAARALGYAEGWSSGQRAAAAQSDAVTAALEREHQIVAAGARANVDNALASLGAAARQLAATTVPVLDDVGDVVLEAAVALARAIIDVELEAMDDVAVAALRRALRPLPTGAQVTVRLNPVDHEQLLAIHSAGAAGSASFDGHDVRLLADASVRRGDAVAEQAGSVVDASIEAALARALDAVRSRAWSL